MKRLFFTVFILGISPGLFTAELASEWPQYRGDARRSGFTTETLPEEPSLLWTFKTRSAPETAWPQSRRMLFDRAFRVVVKSGLLCFGSSADGKVYALDAATGVLRWTFFTDGPVRFAPVFWRDRLLVGSDDGYLYCLDSSSGELKWRRRGGPADSPERTVLGNGRLISLWPARGGPVVERDTVYFAAGIWPSDGILIHAVDPATGKLVWSNTDSGSLRMNQPHLKAVADSGIGAQGHLAATYSQLFVPNGRAVPAAFRREDGKLQYFHLQGYGTHGGTEICISGPAFFNGGVAFATTTGGQLENLGAGAVAATSGGIVRVGAAALEVYTWVDQGRVDRKGLPFTSRELKKTTSIPFPLPEESAPSPDPETAPSRSLIVAARSALVGSRGQVEAYHLDSNERLWSRPVDGWAHELAVANGRLFVSTDRGQITCFGSPVSGAIRPGQKARATIATDRSNGTVDGASSVTRKNYGSIAEEILQRTGIRRGYCIDLDCGDGSLAVELAKRSDLMIYAVTSDPASVESARQRVDQAGLYGSRVVVHARDPKRTSYPPLFANLIVSTEALDGKEGNISREEVHRVLRPFGGKVCLGPPGAFNIETRGPLEGAGEWTHQYADPGNTSCSNDSILKGDLGMFWFGDLGQELPQRHGRAPAPLLCEGRLYSEGLHSLIAVDAYNGTLLWRLPLEGILEAYDADHWIGAAGEGSNYCVSPQGVYLRTEDHCLHIDPETGRERGRFQSPPARDGREGTWGFLATESGRVYGSVADTKYLVLYRRRPVKGIYTESLELFALDGKTGEVLWTRPAQHSIRNNTIALGGRLIYFIDRPRAPFELNWKAPPVNHPGGELFALDAASGEKVWSTEDDVYGTVLIFSADHDALLMCYQSAFGKLRSEIGGRMRVYKASTGSILWESDKASHTTRPVVIGRTIYAEGLALDLLTGKERPFRFERSYGCGQLSSSKHLLVYRSATLGYFDLLKNDRNRDYGGLRLGCWVNAIPAGGLVLVPDAASGCACSYLNRSWIALRPADPEG
jgi:outer membrane protein assembly factor BamB